MPGLGDQGLVLGLGERESPALQSAALRKWFAEPKLAESCCTPVLLRLEVWCITLSGRNFQPGAPRRRAPVPASTRGRARRAGGGREPPPSHLLICSFCFKPGSLESECLAPHEGEGPSSSLPAYNNSNYQQQGRVSDDTSWAFRRWTWALACVSTQ